MPKPTTTTKYRGLFEEFGVDFPSGQHGQLRADACPFCEGAKFYLNEATGLYKCHSENKCGAQGNATNFLRHVYERELAATTDDHRRTLKASRGLSLQTIKAYGLAWRAERGEWLFPAMTPAGHVVNLQRYEPATNSKLTLPGLPLALYGVDGLSPEDERTDRKLIVCEGPWDLLMVDQQLTTYKIRKRYDLLAAPSANVFKGDWLDHFKGYSGVCLGFDNDEAGRKGQERIAKLACDRKLAVKLSALSWPAGHPVKADLGDLVRDGVSVAEFTRRYCVPVTTRDRKLKLTRADAIPDEPKSWLWPNHIPFASFVSLAGRMGTLKSTVVRDLAARATAGLRMPGQTTAPPPMNVLYFTSEDSAPDVGDIVRAHGGDLSRLFVHDIVNDGDEPLDILDCLDEVAEQIAAHNARLVVFDALNSFAGGDISSDAKARRTLSGRLHALARRTGACVIGIRNWGRADAGTGSQKAMGAASLSDIARCVMNTEELQKKNPHEPRRFRLEFEKVSGAPQPRPLEYEVIDLSKGDHDRHLRRIDWLPVVTPAQAEAMVAGVMSGIAARRGGQA